MSRSATIAILGTLCLAGCNTAGGLAPGQPAAAHGPYTGQERWLRDVSFAHLCPDPAALRNSFQCPLIGAGRVRIGEAVQDGFSLRGYAVELDDKRTGYITTADLIMSDSQEEHARKVEEKKRTDARKLAEKQECDRKGGIRVGMSREQVHASCWGKPTKINRTITGSSTHEQLVYPGYNYVYLRDGVVTSIQTSN